jgi:hypothetical protein
MFITPRRTLGALLLVGAGLAPVQAQTNRYAAADSADSPSNSAHALDALSNAASAHAAAAAAPAADPLRGQIAALQSRLDAFMRLSSASTEDNHAALAEIRARLEALTQRLDQAERQPKTAAADPRIDALLKRLDDDERLIAQLRNAAPAPEARAATRPAAAPQMVASTAPVATGKINCNDLAAGDDDAWAAAVAKAYPGYKLDRLDLSASSVQVIKPDGTTQVAPMSSVQQIVGCH